MKQFTIPLAVMFCLSFPSLGSAQNTGRIECPRNDGYVYLYSSMATLEVRATLQCGATVQITGRYDEYLGIRNAKGEAGFVPLATVVILKDQPGNGLLPPSAVTPTRERIHYDDGPRESTVNAQTTPPAFTLLKDTPVHLKLLKTFSSATARVGDSIDLEVVDDVFVEGILVLSKGSKGSGLIAESEPKKRFGHGGKVAFKVTSLGLADGQQVNIRCYQSVSGSPNTSSADGTISIAPGKDAVFLQNSEFTGLIDSDLPLNRDSFAAVANPSVFTPAQALPKSQQ
jgi:hypothetical protein